MKNMKNITKVEEHYVQILESFDSKCRKHNIWYSLAGKLVLSLEKNNKLYLEENILEVFMSANSFNQFKSFFAQNVVDSTTQNNYFFSNPIYWEQDVSVMIKINIIVPAKAEKAERFYSLRNLRRQINGYWLSQGNQKAFKNKFLATYALLTSFIWPPLTWKEIYSNINDEKKYNGYFIIEDMRGNINTHWIPALSFDLSEIEFAGRSFFVIKEYKTYLQKKFMLKNGKEIKPYKNLNFTWILN